MDRTPKNERKTSKFLSYVLRHHPDKIGITLDNAGWVETKVLIKALRDTGWASFTKEQLDSVVENNNTI